MLVRKNNNFAVLLHALPSQVQGVQYEPRLSQIHLAALSKDSEHLSLISCS